MLQLETCRDAALRLDATDARKYAVEVGCCIHVLRCSLRLEAGVMLQFVSASDCISVVGAAAGEARRRGPRPLAALESNSFIFFTFFIVWSSFFRQ